MSLLETARLNGVEPYGWLKSVQSFCRDGRKNDCTNCYPSRKIP
ncbi:transposase domain-containing protein [Salmonella enterica subsp. houtenae]